MSFDVFLQRFPADSLSEKAVADVRAVLERTTYQGPDRFGFYVVTFRDGVRVEFSAKGLDGTQSFSGCAFHIHGMSGHLTGFILDIAKAGDFVILATMEDCIPILSRAEQASSVPKDLPEPVLCESSAELEAMLVGGHAAWRRYRDQVVQKPNQ